MSVYARACVCETVCVTVCVGKGSGGAAIAGENEARNDGLPSRIRFLWRPNR